MKKLMLMEFPGEPKLYSKEEAYEYSKGFIKSLAFDFINMDCFSDAFDEVFAIGLVGFTKAYNKYNIEASHITDCCKGRRKRCGKHPLTKERLKWKYY